MDRLQEIILDYQAADLFTGTTRRLPISQLPGKAAVLIGVRRSGKSTILHQIIKKLLEDGVQRQNILYINFFDDRLHQLQREGAGSILEAYYSLYPTKKNNEPVYCFFDEIQTISGWELFIDRILRTENLNVFLSGSSASMLSKEISTQLRGRSISWEVFPFSFREYLDHTASIPSLPFSSKDRLLAQKLFRDYIDEGAFPEVAGIPRPLRIKVHQEYFNSIVFRDLVERYDISHPRAVSDLAHWLINNTGSMYSINSLSGYLNALGHRASKTHVAQYLDWYEDAYIFYSVRLFDASVARSRVNPKKIYCIDHSMVRSVSSGILVNSGHLLENVVFIGLRRVMQQIYYYKTRTDKEVDFIALNADGRPNAVQVCESLAEPRTLKRETQALTEAMEELGLDSGTIVTKDEDRSIESGARTIRIVPAWRYLLEVQAAAEHEG